MNKQLYQSRRPLLFKRFTRKGYALFACLGREVLIGTLSVATLTHARAEGVAVEVDKASADTSVVRHGELSEVEVTASRAPQVATGRTPRMVTVLVREDIQAAAAQSINDLLKLAAGVDVRQRGPLGAQTDVSVRGGNYEQATILLNGINIGDPQTGHNAVDLPVDISEIERIEVIEGPAGTVYGTSSLLGAINIVTRVPAQSSLTARLEGGSFGYASAAVRGNIARNRFRQQLSAGYSRADGHTRSLSAGTLNGDYRGGRAFYQGAYDDASVALRWQAGVSMRHFGAATFYGPKWDNQAEHTMKSTIALQADTRQGFIHLRPAVYWNHGYDRFELFRGQNDRYPFNHHRTDVVGLSLTTYFDWAAGRTALGGEMRNEDLISTNLGTPLSRPHHISGRDRDYTHGLNRTNTQLYLEHNVTLGPVTAQAGMVAVKNSGADMHMRVYPSVNATVALGRGWSAYASMNTSLRMPSATELFYSRGGHLADPNLLPEELRAWEGGMRYRSELVMAKASVYHNTHTNLIDWIADGTLDDDGSLLWRSVNFGKIEATGLETQAAISMLSLLPGQKVVEHVGVQWAYIGQRQHEPEGIQSLYALEYLKHKLVVDTRLRLYRQLRLALSWRLQHRMGTYTALDGLSHAYGTYGLMDAKLQWTAPRFVLYATINNLTARRYTDIGSVPQPGAWAVGGVEIKL